MYEGSVLLSNDITPSDVLHMPDFHFNLIFVHKMCCDRNYDLLFNHDACYVEGHSLKGPSTLLGKLKAGMCSVEVQNISTQQSSLCNNACFPALNNAKLWHLRLGHLPFSKLILVQPS